MKKRRKQTFPWQSSLQTTKRCLDRHSHWPVFRGWKGDRRRNVSFSRFCTGCVWGSGTEANASLQARLNGYRHGRDRQNKDRRGRKSRARSASAGIDWKVQSNTSKGHKVPEKASTDFRSLLQSPSLKQAVTLWNWRTSTDLSLLSTTLFVLHSPRKVTQKKKKLFCSPVPGWKSSSWSAEAHMFRAQRWARGLGAGGRCLFWTTLRIFISMRSIKKNFKTFWSILNTAAPPQKPALAPTTAHLKPFAVAIHSSICQPALATLKL